METAEGILNQIDGVSAAHGRFYLLQSIFGTIGDTVQYYKSALKFLGCTKMTDLTLAEQRDHAKHLAIAALVSDGIYNFGELVSISLFECPFFYIHTHGVSFGLITVGSSRVELSRRNQR